MYPMQFYSGAPTMSASAAAEQRATVRSTFIEMVLFSVAVSVTTQLVLRAIFKGR